MSEWKSKRLVDYWEFTPKVHVDKEVEYSFIKMTDLISGNKHVYPKSKRKAKGLTKFQNGDTLFAKITPCLENGKICQAQGLEGNVGVGSTEFYVFRGRDKISDNDFIHYLLKCYPIKKYAVKCMTGSAGQQRVPSDTFDQIELPLPDFDESVEIAKILSTLDKKITLLREQNKTLEELAQTIFKRWFVEFEFVCIPKNYEYLGTDDPNPSEDTKAGKLVNSELGEIPEGWRLSTIGGNIETIGGGTLSSKEPTFWEDGEIYWYSPTDLTKEKSMYSMGSAKKITDLGLQKSSAKLFPAYSLLMTSRATVGELTINTQKASTNQGFITLIPNENLSVFFLYNWLKSKLKTVHNLASGSTFPEISKTDFRNIEVLIANKEIHIKFDKTVEPLFKSIENNTKEIQSLTQLRDTLLPKLMSGELRVK